MTVTMSFCHSKSGPTTSTIIIRPIRVFVLQGSAAAKSGYGGSFYSTLWRRYLVSDMPNKLLKSDSNCQSYSKCYSGTLAVSRARCAECIYKVVQQHNLGEVVNSIPRLCTETSQS